jgi:hypothetical protein
MAEHRARDLLQAERSSFWIDLIQNRDDAPLQFRLRRPKVPVAICVSIVTPMLISRITAENAIRTSRDLSTVHYHLIVGTGVKTKRGFA